MRRLPDGLCVSLGGLLPHRPKHTSCSPSTYSCSGDGVSQDKLSFLVAGRDRYTFRPSDLEHDIDADMVAGSAGLGHPDRVTYAYISN
jgi:hypothetical protein